MSPANAASNPIFPRTFTLASLGTVYIIYHIREAQGRRIQVRRDLTMKREI